MRIVNRMMRHKFGWIFSEPVDPVYLNIPDYFDIIKEPMDLGTIKKQLEAGDYETPIDFAEDARLVWHNAMLYNPKGTEIHMLAFELSQQFEEAFLPIAAAWEKESQERLLAIQKGDKNGIEGEKAGGDSGTGTSTDANGRAAEGEPERISSAEEAPMSGRAGEQQNSNTESDGKAAETESESAKAENNDCTVALGPTEISACTTSVVEMSTIAAETTTNACLTDTDARSSPASTNTTAQNCL